MDKLFADAGKFLSANAFAVALVFLFFAVIASMRTLIRHSLGQRTISVVEYTELENMIASPSQAFCDEHESLDKREEACNEISEGKCGETPCCVWAHTATGVAACVAGTKHGPVFLSDPGAEHTYDVTKYVHQGTTYSNRKTQN